MLNGVLEYVGHIGYYKIKVSPWCGGKKYRKRHNPQDFDAYNYFAESYGIVRNPDAKHERIVIRAYGREPYYLRDLPLHGTQTELASGEGYTDFEYRFRISADFYPALLAKGPNIKVLEPEWLVEEIKGQIACVADLYK